MTTLESTARLRDRDSQQVFDALMRALAEPGTIRQLPTPILDDRIGVATWLPLALADVDVNVSIDDDTNGTSAHLVRMVTGARVVPLEMAHIAALSAVDVAQIARIPTGTALDPERGAKIALRVERLVADEPDCSLIITLEGPGVPGRRTLGVDGLDDDVAQRLGTASGAFPAGFDTWLVADDGSVAAISRSTTVSTPVADRPYDRKVA